MEFTNDKTLFTKFEKRLKWIIVLDAIFFIWGFADIIRMKNIDLNDSNQVFEILMILLAFFSFLITAVIFAPKCTALLNLSKNKLIIDEEKISGFKCNNLHVKNSAAWFEKPIESIRNVEVLYPINNGEDFYNLAIYCQDETIKLALTKNEEAKNEILKRIKGCQEER